jgi:hypothetical protein
MTGTYPLKNNNMNEVKKTASKPRRTVITYDTVSEAVNDLARRGYNANLALCAEKQNLLHNGQPLGINPEQFQIDETYRFEGITDPADETIVFAISAQDHRIKGVLVNAFGVYASDSTSALVNRLQAHINPLTK